MIHGQTNIKSKAVPLHTMKAQEETGHLNPKHLREVSGQLHVAAALSPGELHYQLTRNKAERATESAWTFRCAGNVPKQTSL